MSTTVVKSVPASTTCLGQSSEVTTYNQAKQATSRNSLSSLVPETIETFLNTQVHRAATRPVPFETQVTTGELAWEYVETLSFEQKQLKADPRLKPSDIHVDMDHLRTCTECQQRQKAQFSVHGHLGVPIDMLSAGWQLLVDDHVIETFQNTIRFQNPPKEQSIVMRPWANSSAAVRFGCPCSVLRNPRDQTFRLYHTAGAIASEGHRYHEWPAEYRYSTSSNGVDGWHYSRRVSIDGFEEGVTGSFTATRFRPGRAAAMAGQNVRPAFVAGYEGANSKVCIAHSPDGRTWSTVPTNPRPLAVPEEVLRGRTGAQRRRPAHLTKSHVKVNLRKNPFARDCRQQINACIRAGASWGGGVIWSCIQDMAINRSLPANSPCSLAIAPHLGFLMRDCIDGTASALGRAGDCNVQPVFDEKRKRHLVWYRRDFGTPGGWREIRGVQVVEFKENLFEMHMRPTPIVKPLQRVGSYYLDRLGKLERYRRQIYSVTLTRHSDELWLGLVTIIEWAKDLSEPVGNGLPSFKRDTTQIYLVTSRDGIHIDFSWVYARQPLIPKGKLQGDWDSGFLLAADQIVADSSRTQSRVYFEARKTRHEDRFKEPAVIGMARWNFDAIVGLRAADPNQGPAVITTKSFMIPWTNQISVAINADARSKSVGSACGEGSIHVELMETDAASIQLSSTPIVEEGGTSMKIKWNNRKGTSPLATVKPGSIVRLRFTLTGNARLYAFRVQSHTSKHVEQRLGGRGIGKIPGGPRRAIAMEGSVDSILGMLNETRPRKRPRKKKGGLTGALASAQQAISKPASWFG